jgi:hypothetical protein
MHRRSKVLRANSIAMNIVGSLSPAPSLRAKRSNPGPRKDYTGGPGLLRRFAPRNDGEVDIPKLAPIHGAKADTSSLPQNSNFKSIAALLHRAHALACIPACKEPVVVPGALFYRVASASNSEIVSFHRSASRSRSGFNPATCFATRRRTARERASATTRRSSRKPRAGRRCRIIFILSARA